MQHPTVETKENRETAHAASLQNSSLKRASSASAAFSAHPTGYQSGFGSEFATEALPGALPVGRNSPQRVAYGLYAEQFSGTAFTAPRSHNRRSWLYRIRPAAVHKPFTPLGKSKLVSDFSNVPQTPPNQLRWDPLPLPQEPTDFIDGLVTMAGNGSAESMTGCAIHMYAANRSMHDRFFYSADGELLIVPQLGTLSIATEFGLVEVGPQEIAVIPRGTRFRVELLDGDARGYVCENFGALLRLPDLGPIGSNGLANPRDFLTPQAAYEVLEGNFELVAKLNGQLWRADIDHSPLDVVAWHGNYAPYKYDLRQFNTIGSISFDHPDPSIFLVLQSPSDTPGVDSIDFVIFPPRWLAAEDTFRPPGSIAMLPASSWVSFMANMTRRRKASSQGAQACITACPATGLTPAHSTRRQRLTPRSRPRSTPPWPSCSRRARSSNRRSSRSKFRNYRRTTSSAGRGSRTTSIRK